MYQKIKNSLFFPRQLATSYKERVIGFIIFLIICTSLPFILHICVNGIITSNDIRNVKLAFYENTLVDYKIEDHKLVAYGENQSNRYLVVEEGNIGVAFIGSEEGTIEVTERFIIVFQEDGLYLSIPLPYIEGISFQLDDYSNLEDIDFNDAKTLENNEFWQILLTYIDDIMDSIKFIVYPVCINLVIVEMIIKVLMGILMNTVILLIFERTAGIKFKEVFKNTTIAFFPYVIAVIFAYAFNIGLLMNLGNIVAFIYAMIANNEYRRIKIKENM